MIRIVIPADVVAAVTATNERHNAEAKRLSEAAAANGNSTPQVRRSETVYLEINSDVSPEVLADCVELFEMWYDYDDQPIEWHSFFDRLEEIYNLCVIEPDSAAARKIQRALRQHRKAGE